MSSRTEAITVTAAIIVRNNRVFAARRKPGKHLEGFWEFPGGKIEPFESPEQCLERELTEEFGITTDIGEFIGENTYDYGDKVIRLVAYRVIYVSGEFDPSDHDKLKWLSLGELQSVNWAPADIPLVQRVSNFLKDD